MRLLLVEDDLSIRQLLSEILIDRKYVVDVASDGQAGWDFVETFDYDLILLDVMLPKLHGFSFCHRLRENGYKMPVMMLTAVDSVAEKVKGLDVGADDYMVKPFKLEELLARIRALLRRGVSSVSPVLKWGDLSLNSNTGEVKFRDKILKLTPKEYRLLELFMRNGDKLLTRNAILENLWSFEEPPTEDAIKAHIKRLRNKLSNKGAANCIQTVYGLGYRLV